MPGSLNDRSTRLRLASYAILAAGLLAALVLYWNAGAADGGSGYDPEDSKSYLRQMEVYGGKANLAAYDVREWFGSLWHGTRLAVTVAVLSVLVAGGFRLAAIPLPPLEEAAGGPGDGSSAGGGVGSSVGGGGAGASSAGGESPRGPGGSAA